MAKTPETAPETAPDFKLVVRESFLKYFRGAVITDPDEIKVALAEYPDHVVKVAL